MDPCTVNLTIPFSTEREAEIAYNTLRVDPEPKRSSLKKQLTLNGDRLSISFNAPNARALRVGVNGFMDLLILTIETMDKFGPPVET